MNLDAAIEVFVQAFSLGKSVAHPYLAQQVDGLWVMRDAPGRKCPRKIEVVSHGLDPRDVVQRIQRARLGWHFLCHVHPVKGDYQGIRDAYKSLGYRALSTEALFIHDLCDIPEFESEPPVRRVFTQAEANSIPQIAKHKLKLLAGSRQFAVWDEHRDYGYVRSVPVKEDAWVSNLYVHGDSRGRGFGRALMSALLRTDRSHGVRTSVLLASSDGARLYPHLGYRRIGVLQMFCPVTRDPSLSHQ